MSGCGLAPFALARLQRVAASVDDVNEERPKAVVLRPMGECPQWGAEPGAETPMDGPIREGRDAPFEEQRELFFGLVRHLHDAQVRVPEDERDDPSDNDEWIATLAFWFGWDDDVRDIGTGRQGRVRGVELRDRGRSARRLRLGAPDRWTGRLVRTRCRHPDSGVSHLAGSVAEL